LGTPLTTVIPGQASRKYSYVPGSIDFTIKYFYTL
jgi:hypothetical protein